MLNLILSRARATELEARARAIDTQRRRADRAAAAKMATPGPAPVTQGGEPRFWILFAR
jgi:hypothetical protein